MTEEEKDRIADRLLPIAAGLVTRVREDDPEANARFLWPLSVRDLRDLCIILAALVPEDRSLHHLTAWLLLPGVDTPEVVAERQRVLVEALAPGGLV